jgi:hypothetical protein
MPKLNPKRHLSAREVLVTVDWIMHQPDVPSWAEVSAFVRREFGIDRTVEAIRRNADLKAAREAREAAPKARKIIGPRPTTRKIKALEAEIERLTAEIHLLQGQNSALIQRNLRLINGARVHQIPECDLDRPLVPVNRNPTNLPERRSRK